MSSTAGRLGDSPVRRRLGPSRRLLRLLAILILMSPFPSLGQRGRYAPPPEVECDRNKLTSYIGRVIRYARKADRIRLTLRTDEDTSETVSFAPGDKMLIEGRAMKPGDWQKVEERPGALRPGMRAIIWVCQEGRPVLDWRPPQR